MPKRVGLAGALFAAAGALSGLTYTVTSTANSGPGSLRQAILNANANPGNDTIQFAIVGSGVHTITLASELAVMTGGTTIDGYTQPGSAPNTNPPELGSNAVILIEIDAAGRQWGLHADAAPIVVRGLAIHGTEVGIQLGSQSTGAVVAGNFIGTYASGLTSPFSQVRGLFLQGPASVQIGGTSPADRNVISGNGTGIFAIDSSGLQVKGNLIGPDATGTRAVPSNQGLQIAGGAGVVVGGTTAAERNVISGHNAMGVLFGTDASILGNYIGVDVSGKRPLPNSNGIYANGPGGMIKGNVISSNATLGILSQAFVDGPTIQGNWIGTDEAETLDLGNGGLYGGGIAVYGTNWVIGGPAPGEGNVIAYNRGLYSGVSVTGSQARIRGNRMYGNRELAIDQLELGNPLDNAGITANDPGDGDVGAFGNTLQNFPLIGTVTPGASTTEVQGTLDSTPATIFDLDFYAGPPCTPFVRDALQGRDYLGASQVTTDGAGHVAFSVDLPVVLQAGQIVSATATDPLGSTSEVSQGLLFRVEPGYGPAAGSSRSLFGMLFESGATVTVGGVPATDVNVVSAGQIDFTAPALTPGSASDVVVSNPSGSSGTLLRAYVASFNDVDGGFFDDVIATLVANQVTAGCGDGIYCPASNITRAQMAVFLLKGKYGSCYAPPAATGTVFPDVPADSFAAAWIEALAAEGITAGCGGGNYCPGNPVLRQQMAVFLLKAEHGSTYLPPPCAQVFNDVSCTSTFAPWINRLFAEQISAGCTLDNYCPLNNATRAQMAAFIVRTFSLR